MRIGIDISQIVHEGTGVATYTRELVRALVKVTEKDKEIEFVLFGTSLRKLYVLREFTERLQGPTLKTRFFPIPPTLAEPLFNQLTRPNIELFTGGLDVFHSSDWLEPRANCPKVTVVHDLAMFRFTEVAHPKILETHRRKLALVKKESAKVIAVSESTKRDLVELVGVEPERIAVIYEAAGNKFKPYQKRSLLDKYGVGGRYIFALGTREPRKNLPRVIKAFSKLHLPGVKLVIVGKFGWGEDVEPVRNVSVVGYVPDEDLPALYSRAEVFVYPSLYEGFGLPVLEAMSCATPVVTSNVSSLPEVAGNAAVLVDPTDVNAIAAGVQKALKEKEELVAKGLAQAKKFSWERTAWETLEVYKRVAHSHNDHK